MKCLAYQRVSTDGQVGDDKFGLADQADSINTFASQQGYEIVGWYEDAAISGASLDRPGLMQLLSDSADSEIKGIIVAKMDRMARDLMSQLWIEKELLKNNVELISVAEPFRGQDPANILFRQIIGAFAQFEKSRISERMSGGRKMKAKSGGYSGGRAPIGYKASRVDKSLEIVNEKADIVRRVFELKSLNPAMSLQAIADLLNDEGHTTAQDKQFKKMQVKRILDREDIYSGLYRYAGIEAQGQHQALLSFSA